MIKSKWQFILRHTCIGKFTFKQFGNQKNKANVGKVFYRTLILEKENKSKFC